MRTSILIMLFFSIYSCAFTQQSTISKSKFSNKTNIPSTKVFLKIPDGFHVSKTINGLEKNDNVGIIIMDFAGGNYNSNTATFTEENFKTKVETVISFREHKVDDFSAKTVHLKTIDAEGFILVFGDSTFSTMLTGMVPHGDSISLLQIEECLKTVSYDKSLKLDPLSFAKFELNTTDKPYKFEKTSAGMYIYEKSINPQMSSENKTTFVVNQMPYGEEFTPELIAQQTILSMQQYGFEYEKNVSESSEPINGYESFEIIVAGKQKNKKVIIYLLVIAKQNNSFSCLATIKDDFDNELKEIKSISRSIKLKY